MLTDLLISNFTLVKHQELRFLPGLTALTGETGAGKSILLDALGLALGDKADVSKIRAGETQAEVCASFDVGKLPKVQQWLADAELGSDECILRRIVLSQGRARAQINGRPVTQGQLRALGEQLLDIHSQHEHQSLLVSANHRKLLDGFGQHEHLAVAVKQAYSQWQLVQAQLLQVRDNNEEMNARFQLLSYQADELNQLGLQPNELNSLETEQKRLACAEQVQQSCEEIAALCVNSDNAIASQLHRAVSVLQKLPFTSAQVVSAKSMLAEALIQIEEAGHELDAEAGANTSGSDLPRIESRLSAIYDVARKHRVGPEALADLHRTVLSELEGLSSGDAQVEQLEASLAQAAEAYHGAAKVLSSARVRVAKKLCKAINAQLHNLAMAYATLEIQLNPATQPQASGAEAVELLIATVPGSPASPLHKVASGGELSRVSLAIQVVTAKTAVTPTLVFDEVDVGIGGATGDVIGTMLRQLGQSAQILCVTHLAQVASKANHHLTVEKVVSKKAASTDIQVLDQEGRVLEVARMMGGAVDSKQSLAHAREMLCV